MKIESGLPLGRNADFAVGLGESFWGNVRRKLENMAYFSVRHFFLFKS